jgi:signal transduction histidine kinase
VKRIVAWVLLAVDVLGAVAITVMVVLHTARSATVLSTAALVFMALSFAVVGGLLALRRPRNAEGWLLLAVGTAWLVPMASVGLGQSLLEQQAGGTVAAWLAWPGVWLWLPPLGLMGTQVLLRFPDGALPSRRWRWFSRLTLVLVATVAIAMAIAAPTDDDGYVNLTYLPWVPRSLVLAVGLAALACFPVSVASVVVRYRRAGTVEREQIRWVAWAAGVFVGIYLLGLLGFIPFLPPAFTGSEAMNVITFLAYSLVPVAIGFAILRHRLYDIDVIISRAVVYGLLSAAFTGVYAGIVVGIGTFVGHRGGPVLTIAAAVTIALLFQPLRRRAQLFANRLVYGKRATPYQALSDFAGDMAGQLDLTEAVDRMVTVLAGATGADRAEAWIRVGTELRPASIWPHGATPSAAVALGPGGGLPAFEGASRAVAVQHGGELLGALSLQKPRNESLTSTEDELLQDLASQAGLVLRNAALIDELRASRRRLVEAQDAERRKIERNLHDGAQQQLIALMIQLGLLEESADDPAAVRQLAPAVKDGLRAALEDLRDLARGIYPPLLADQGLVPALQAQARKAALPVQIDADGIGRYPQDTEAAVYFCALEALQNITKYAGASRAAVGLSCSGGSLRFTVTDDGAGFDTASTRHGTGLQGMADRLAALGGALNVRSQPGRGTTLTGQLPVSAAGPAEGPCLAGLVRAGTEAVTSAATAVQRSGTRENTCTSGDSRQQEPSVVQHSE